MTGAPRVRLLRLDLEVVLAAQVELQLYPIGRLRDGHRDLRTERDLPNRGRHRREASSEPQCERSGAATADRELSVDRSVRVDVHLRNVERDRPQVRERGFEDV